MVEFRTGLEDATPWSTVHTGGAVPVGTVVMLPATGGLGFYRVRPTTPAGFTVTLVSGKGADRARGD